MILTNYEIYNYATKLATFNIAEKMPIKINFFLQRNIQNLIKLAEEIDAAREKIAQSFGELNAERTEYLIPPDKMEEAHQELNDLFELSQEVNIHIFKLDDFNNIELTMEQLSLIMFMIEE